MFFLPFVVALWQGVGPNVGDTWKIERSYRFLNVDPKIDFTNREQTEYVVGSVDASGISISQRRRFMGGTSVDGVQPERSTEAKTRDVKLGPGGAPSYTEDTTDIVAAMVDRVQWSAAEGREGVSWSRRFAGVGSLKGAKLTVKPTSSKADSRTLAVTYVEEGRQVIGEATVIVALPKRIVTSLKLTFDGVPLGSTGQPVKVVVNQQILVDK